MFTGLIETTGVVTARKMTGDAGKLTVIPDKNFLELEAGESIAVNGACLTLEQGMNGGPLVFHVMRETFSRTNIGTIPIGTKVNMERALPANGRLGGHIVSGHVDAVAKILEISKRDSDLEILIELPENLEEFFVEKGSIAVNGISLTLEKITKGSFRVGVIPTTWRETMLSFAKPGDVVNLETDILGKYVVAALKRMTEKKSGLSMEMLAEAGFL